MKTHVSLPASDLSKSVAFYHALLDSAPVKHYDDYALFLPEQPALELALSAGPATSSHGAKAETRAHFGIAVDSTQVVDDAIARLEAARIPVEIERDETCCYAKQTKVWASDPDGRRWEVYTVLEESARADTQGCCTS